MREGVSARSLQLLTTVPRFRHGNDADLPAVVVQSDRLDRPKIPGCCRWISRNCGRSRRDDVGKIDDLESSREKGSFAAPFHLAGGGTNTDPARRGRAPKCREGDDLLRSEARQFHSQGTKIESGWFVGLDVEHDAR